MILNFAQEYIYFYFCYIHPILCFRVEIKKICFWNCCPGRSNELVPQIVPHLNSSQYPLINYLCHRLKKTFGLCPSNCILLHQEIKFILVFIFDNWFVQGYVYIRFGLILPYFRTATANFYRQGCNSCSHISSVPTPLSILHNAGKA